MRFDHQRGDVPNHVDCRALLSFCAVLAGPAAGIGCGDVPGAAVDASAPDMRAIIADPSVADVIAPADATAGVEAAVADDAGGWASTCKMNGGSWPSDAAIDCVSVTCPVAPPEAGSPCEPTGPPELECEYDSDAGCSFALCVPDAGWAFYGYACLAPGASRPRLGSPCSAPVSCGSACGPRFVCYCGSWRLGPYGLPCVL